MEMKQKLKQIDEKLAWEDCLDVDSKIFREIVRKLQKDYGLKIKHKSDIRDIASKVAISEGRDFINFADVFVFSAIECDCIPTIEQLDNVLFETIFVRISDEFKNIAHFLLKCEAASPAIRSEKARAFVQQAQDFIEYLNWEFKKKNRINLIMNNPLVYSRVFHDEMTTFLNNVEERIHMQIKSYFNQLEQLIKVLK